MNYGIDTGNGDAVTTGLPEQTARRTAQRLANERGESLYLYALAEGDGEPGESEEISPKPTIGVQASNPRPSQYTEEPSEDSPRGVLVGAVDVDVVVTIGGQQVEGTVTLARNEADKVTLESWGSPDMWVSGELLAAIWAASEDSDARRNMLSTLAAEAAVVGQRVAP